jgi:hypothetical protein
VKYAIEKRKLFVLDATGIALIATQVNQDLLTIGAKVEPYLGSH